MSVTKMYVTDEDRDAAAWVREHGGIDHVKSEWRSRVPYDRYVRRRQSLLDHIAECETALGRRNQRIKELKGRVKALTNENAELRRRAMPEGYEWLIEAWPKFEDDAPVKLGDMALIDGDVDMVEAVQIWIHGKPVIYGDNGSQQLEKGERVKRPAVPAADGEPLEVGQTVWDTNGDELVIGAIEDGGHTVACRYVDVGDGIQTHGMWSPSDLTHQRPVLDADGVPINVGDTVWRLTDGKKHKVTGINPQFGDIRVKDESMELGVWDSADGFTHAKPEIDTWQCIEEDARWMDSGADCGMFTYTHEDIVRRCRALAERERGE